MEFFARWQQDDIGGDAVDAKLPRKLRMLLDVDFHRHIVGL
jgi:hypothetical protein